MFIRFVIVYSSICGSHQVSRSIGASKRNVCLSKQITQQNRDIILLMYDENSYNKSHSGNACRVSQKHNLNIYGYVIWSDQNIWHNLIGLVISFLLRHSFNEQKILLLRRDKTNENCFSIINWPYFHFHNVVNSIHFDRTFFE